MWFGCDVTKNFATKPGLADTKAHDYELLYGTSVNEVLSKADRLIYGESEMTHAMVITGVQTDVSWCGAIVLQRPVPCFTEGLRHAYATCII